MVWFYLSLPSKHPFMMVVTTMSIISPISLMSTFFFPYIIEFYPIHVIIKTFIYTSLHIKNETYPTSNYTKELQALYFFDK